MAEGDPRINLIQYGVPKTHIKWCLNILPTVSSAEELDKELRGRGTPTDDEQFLMPVFRPLFTQDPTVREAVLRRLGGLGVTQDMIQEYFTASGNHPSLVFHLNHEETIGLRFRERFTDAARSTIFDTVKSYLGL